MRDGPDLAYIASLIGDPARANILAALMSGKALTPSELAMETGLTRQTVSSHLGKLLSGGLILGDKQGRHRYVRLAGEEVAIALESLMALSSDLAPPRVRTGPKDKALRKARVCYDHLAGELGVHMYDQMVSHGWLNLKGEGLDLSLKGEQALKERNVPLASVKTKRRALCRSCLDWSERRHHLAGGLGALLLNEVLARNWARREDESRAIRFSPQGEVKFRHWFD